MAIHFITGPEGSGTTALVLALSNHPGVVKGDAARYHHSALHAAAGAQLLPAELMSRLQPGRFDFPDPAEARRRFQENGAALFAAQPGTRAIFFKYSTPAFRPSLWPVFLPLFEAPEFRVVVIWRRPMDSIHSAFRRFYRDYARDELGFLAAIRTHVRAVRHIRGQLARSPHDRCFILRYETLVARPELVLGELFRFAGLDHHPVERLLPGRGFSNENGKWKESLRRMLMGKRA